MIITIGKDGKHAFSQDDKKYKIRYLLINKEEGGTKYKPTDRFFKMACPPGTKHNAVIIENTGLKLIDIY